MLLCELLDPKTGEVSADVEAEFRERASEASSPRPGLNPKQAARFAPPQSRGLGLANLNRQHRNGASIDARDREGDDVVLLLQPQHIQQRQVVVRRGHRKQGVSTELAVVEERLMFAGKD